MSVKKGALLPLSVTDDLINEIDKFLGMSGLTAREFGLDAMSNATFVKYLRLDRPRLYEYNVARARRFMKDWEK